MLSDDEIEVAKRIVEYRADKPFHEHNDCI